MQQKMEAEKRAMLPRHKRSSSELQNIGRISKNPENFGSFQLGKSNLEILDKDRYYFKRLGMYDNNELIDRNSKKSFIIGSNKHKE